MKLQNIPYKSKIIDARRYMLECEIISAVTAAVIAQYKLERLGVPATRQMQLLIGGLYNAWATRDGNCLRIPLNRNAFNTGSMFHDAGMTSSFPKAYERLRDCDAIDFYPGDSGMFGGREALMTVIQPSKSMMAIFKTVAPRRERSKLAVEDDAERTLIRISTGAGNDKISRECKRSELSEAALRRDGVCRAYNKMMSSAFVALADSRESTYRRLPSRPKANQRAMVIRLDCAVDLHATYARGSFEMGGRLYHVWQQLPAYERRSIEINGLPTIDRDFTSLHLRLAYARLKIEAKAELYAGIPGTEHLHEDPKVRRLICKEVINARMNRDSDEGIYEVVHGIGFKRRDGDLMRLKKEPLLRAFEAIKLHHAKVWHLFGSHFGAELQAADSLIAEKVIADLTAKGLPHLPIHDGFRIADIHEEALLSAMTKAYREVTGFPNATVYTSKVAYVVPEDEKSPLYLKRLAAWRSHQNSLPAVPAVTTGTVGKQTPRQSTHVSAVGAVDKPAFIEIPLPQIEGLATGGVERNDMMRTERSAADSGVKRVPVGGAVIDQINGLPG